MKRLILLFILNFYFLGLIAQESQIKTTSTNTWFLVTNKLKINEKWSFTNELHERTAKVFHYQNNFIVRPSIDYSFKNLEFTLGYSYLRFANHGNYIIPKEEHNIWQQVLIKNKFDKITIKHRFRQENRFVKLYHFEETSNKDYFANRFRYRFILIGDIFKFQNPEKTIFIHFFDEVWINQNNQFLPINFSRNWMFLGLGFKANKQTNFQLGLLHQCDRKNSFELTSTPVFQFVLEKNFQL
jgi:hypothetical protein